MSANFEGNMPSFSGFMMAGKPIPDNRDLDLPKSIFILVQEEGAYSDKDWKVHGVFNTQHDAILAGFKCIVEEALKPWILTFYKERDARFAGARGLSEFHIEEWIVGKEMRNLICLGYKNERPYKHYIDQILKEAEVKDKGSEALILKWKKELDDGYLPSELVKLVINEGVEA